MKDQIVADGKWQFGEDVTEVFEDMLERSIVQYPIMRELCFEVGRRFVQPKTAVLDLGCSTGEALRPFIDAFGAHNQFYGLEVSEPMLEKVREKFKGYINSGIVVIKKMDLRNEFPPVKASVVLSILTLQFTPIEYRQYIMQRIHKSLIDGGALIFVEKVLGNSPDLDGVMVQRYYEIKEQNGYTREQIDSKRTALEGVLVPVTASWNEELLRNAGFSKVDCFWRYLNFSGWVAVK